jgi:glycogen debranching enzyme
MRLGQDVLSDLDAALACEWVLANGLGGAAAGTAALAPTRFEHAHLIAGGAYGRPVVLLLGLEERLVIEGATHDLGTRFEPGGRVRPAGYRLLDRFDLDPWPTWHYRVNGVSLEKSLFMIYGHHALAAIYRHRAGPDAVLTVRPLMVARGLSEPEGGPLRGTIQAMPGRVRVETREPHPGLTFWHDGSFMPARAAQSVVHRARSGEATSEEALVPGHVEISLGQGQAFHLIVSAEEDLFRALAQQDRLGSPPPRSLAGCVAAVEAGERERIESWRQRARTAADLTARQALEARARSTAAAAPADGKKSAGSKRGAAKLGAANGPATATVLDPSDPWVTRLAHPLHLGLTRRNRRLTLLTTLPRGAERGAETLRAIPGLIAFRGFESAREILRGYLDYLDEGFAPASFDLDRGDPVYGAPEPALWLAIAGELYGRRSGDTEFEQRALTPALEAIAQAYRSGTRHDVRLDAQGLLSAGGTPSAGLNALWYHASIAMAELARRAGHRESAAFHIAWAKEHQKSVNDRLWSETQGCLLDGGDASEIAPEQLFAVSLPPSLLLPERARRMIETIERELWTPFGLRATPGDETVETAWLGPFYSAYLRAHGRSAAAQARVREGLETLRRRLDSLGIVTIPESFDTRDPDLPSPTGEPLSILAAAELARFWIEDLEHAGVPALA